MANRYMKSNSARVVKEMRAKTAVNYPLAPVRMTTVRQTRADQCWQRYGNGGNHVHYRVKSKWIQP
jgi:hypothetical protein